MFDDPNWTNIIAVSGIFLGILSVLLTIKIDFGKELEIVDWDNKKVNDNPSNNTDTFNLHQYNIVFQNLGKLSILKSDIVGKIRMEVINGQSIKNVHAESSCKYNSVNVTLEKNIVEFDFDFLESKKYIRLCVTYIADETKEIDLKGKIIGGSELDCKLDRSRWESEYYVGKKDAEARIFKFPITLLGLFFLISTAFMKMFNITDEKLKSIFTNPTNDTLLVVFVGLIILTISILLSIRIRRAFIPFAMFARKDKSWYSKGNYST